MELPNTLQIYVHIIKYNGFTVPFDLDILWFVQLAPMKIVVPVKFCKGSSGTHAFVYWD